MNLKEKLSNGCLVEYRSGQRAIFLKDANVMGGVKSAFFGVKSGRYTTLDVYGYDLMQLCDLLDVMKIYNPEYAGEAIRRMSEYEVPWTWIREEKTQREIEMEKLQEKINELQVQYDKLKGCE